MHAFINTKSTKKKASTCTSYTNLINKRFTHSEKGGSGVIRIYRENDVLFI